MADALQSIADPSGGVYGCGTCHFSKCKSGERWNVSRTELPRDLGGTNSQDVKQRSKLLFKGVGIWQKRKMY